MSKTVRQVIAENIQYLYRVPKLRLWDMCYECFAPVQQGYRRCYQCNQMFSAAPDQLSGKTVPITVVEDPSPWYTRIKGYKGGMPAEFRPVVASVAYLYLKEHLEQLAALLGGEPDLIAVTPSKGRHAGVPHPLRKTLELVKGELVPIVEPLVYVGGDKEFPRGAYKPEYFQADDEIVADQRIILVEDLWVSGRTTVSAAGALLAAGAESVVIVPIARKVHLKNPVMVPADHPFFEWVKEPFDLSHWPR